MKKQKKNSHVLEPYVRQVPVSAVEAELMRSQSFTGAVNVTYHFMKAHAADAGWRQKS